VRPLVIYGITQCYLPPERGDSYAFTPSVLPVLIYRPNKLELRQSPFSCCYSETVVLCGRAICL